MARIKFYLKRPFSKGETNLFANISYNGKALKLYVPELRIEPSYWNKEKQEARSRGSFNSLRFNHSLSKFREQILEIYQEEVDKNGYPSKEKLRKVINSKLNKPKANLPITLIEFLDVMISNSEKGLRTNIATNTRVKENTIKTYRTAKKTLEQFAIEENKLLELSSIDLDFYKEYKQYMEEVMDYSINTIGKHFAIIKLALSEAESEGIIVNQAYKGKKFQVPRVEATTIYLDEEELTEILNIDLSNNRRLERVRDLFIIAANTGLRISDYTRIQPEHIDLRNEIIRITQIKTKKLVEIPILKTTSLLLRKYDNKIPTPISNQKMNDYLKEICSKVELLHKTIEIQRVKGSKIITSKEFKYNLVTSHTARRSFATNQYLKHQDVVSIMKITGHSTTKSFFKYIKVDERQAAERIREYNK